jgi:hypothetical protein
MAKTKKYLETNGIGEDRKFEVRCQKLVRAWQKRQEEPLKKRQKLLALWASGFFDGGYGREHLINLIDRGVFTIVPYLVEGNPKILVETKIANCRPWAFTTQLALNFILDKMNFAEKVLIPAAINSMFGAGITRTFTEYDRVINLDDNVIRYGKQVIRVIDDADYIGDVAAKTRDDFILEGDIYKLPTDYAKDLYHKSADDISSDCKLTSDYHPEKISNGEWDLNRLSLREYTSFIDLYLYDEGVTITIMPYGKTAKILHTIEEDGPGGSPYDFLGYKFFPGTTYPIPPAWAWHDLDVTMNILAKTAREQAESQKDIIAVTPQGREFGKKIITAKNLDVLEVDNPNENVNKLSFGGVNPDNYNWMMFAEQSFTKTGASSDVLAGRGSQSPTLGQEQMVFQNASRIVNNMNTRFQGFMTSIVNKLAYKVLQDPSEYIPLIHQIPGVGDLPKVFSSADRVEDFYSFVFSIRPYSTQRTSPKVLAQELMGFMTQWVLPTYQFAAQQGAELDVPLVTRILSDYMGFENFNQFYRTAIPHELDGVGYIMQPMGQEQRPKGPNVGSKKSPGQSNDTFGSSESSRTANMQQQQKRTTGGQTK